MESDTLILYEYWYYRLAYLKYRHHKNEVFDFISFRYKITDLQEPETL